MPVPGLVVPLTPVELLVALLEELLEPIELPLVPAEEMPALVELPVVPTDEVPAPAVPVDVADPVVLLAVCATAPGVVSNTKANAASASRSILRLSFDEPFAAKQKDGRLVHDPASERMRTGKQSTGSSPACMAYGTGSGPVVKAAGKSPSHPISI